MTRSGTSQDLSLESVLPFSLFLLGCALFTVLFSVFGYLNPMILLGALAVFAACIVVFALVGSVGLLLCGMVSSSVLLMVRFDEQYAISIGGGLHIKGIYLLMLAVLGALCAYIVAYRLISHESNGAITRYAHGMAWPLAGFVGTALVAVLINHWANQFGVKRYAAGEVAALGTIALPISFALLIPLSNLSEKRTLLCLRGIVLLGGLAGFVMAMFGLLPGAVLGALGWGKAMVGTADLVRGRLPLGHPNTVAAFMILLLPATVIMGLGDRRLFWRVFYLACGATMFCGVLFALSRGALLCTMFITVCAFVSLLYTMKGRMRLIGFGLVIVVALLLVAVASVLFARFDFSRLWSRGYHETASVERRTESMLAAAAIWRDHKFLGVSPDAVYPRLDLRVDWKTATEDQVSPIVYYRGMRSAETPHNMYLTALAEFGLIGAAFFFYLIYHVLIWVWRSIWRKNLLVYDQRLLLSLGLGMCGFLMMGMFEALLFATLRASIIFWIFAGLTARFILLTASSRPQIPSKTPEAG